MSLESEIHAQPAAIDRARRAAQRQLPAVRDLLAGHDVAHVVIAARGTSDNAARWAQYLWGRRTGLPVRAGHPVAVRGRSRTPPAGRPGRRR